MERLFYKSLDREFELFGIRGRWVRIVLMAFGASIFAGIVFGFAFNSAIGVVVAIIGSVVSFIVCLMKQTSTPSRRLDKAAMSSKTAGWVIRRETVSRILLRDEEYEKQKEAEV